MARFFKELFKHVFWIMGFMLAVGIALFITDAQAAQYSVVVAVVGLMFVIAMLFLLVGLIKGSLKIFGIKDRLQGFFAIVTAIACVVVVVKVLIPINGSINRTSVNVLGKEDIAIEEKIGVFRTILEEKKEMVWNKIS